MLSRVTLANAEGTDIVLHEDTATSRRLWQNVKGLLGVGALRDSKRPRPSAHGSINETTFEEGRVIQATGEVWSQVSIEKAIEEFRAIIAPMLQTLDVGPALLKWTEGSTGLKLQMLVTLDSEVEPTLQEAQQFLNYPVSFFAEDPRAYSQTLTTAKGASITGSAFEASFLKTLNKAIAVCVDAGHIYWVDGVTSAIGRATLAGGTIENEWVKTELPPLSLAVDSAHVYYGQKPFGPGAYIGRATIAGATVESKWLLIAESVSQGIQALAVNAANIYWATGTPGHSIGRAPIGGGSKENEWLLLPAGYAAKALALDTTYLYYGLGNEIGRVKLTGEENKQQWMSGTGAVFGVAVNPTFVYWLDQSGRSVGRAKLNGTEPNAAFISGLGSEPTGLAVNTEHLYWGEAGFIARSKELAGGGPIGSEVKVKNLGNRPAPMVFKIAGAALNPSIVRKSDGARIAMRGEVSAGNFLEVDTAARTIKLNGEGSLLAFFDSAGTTAWFAAPPSPTEEGYLLTVSSATAATLEVLYRSAYA